MCYLCTTFIELNNYWKRLLGLEINKNNYINLEQFGTIINSLSVKEINNIIIDLSLHQITCFDENMDDEIAWIQRKQLYDYLISEKSEIGHFLTDEFDPIHYSADNHYAMENQIKYDETKIINDARYLSFNFNGINCKGYVMTN